VSADSGLRFDPCNETVDIVSPNEVEACGLSSFQIRKFEYAGEQSDADDILACFGRVVLRLGVSFSRRFVLLRPELESLASSAIIRPVAVLAA
jgi:hypothetical protein